MQFLINTVAVVVLLTVLGLFGTMEYEDRVAEAKHTQEIMRNAQKQAKENKLEREMKRMIAFDRIAAK